MGRYRPLHKENLFFIDSIIGVQVENLLGLAPTEIPKYQKGTPSLLQVKK